MKSILLMMTFFLASTMEVKVNFDSSMHSELSGDLAVFKVLSSVQAEQNANIKFVNLTLDDGKEISCPTRESVSAQIKEVCSANALPEVVAEALNAGNCTISSDGSTYSCADKNAKAAQSSGMKIWTRVNLCQTMQKTKYKSCEQAAAAYEGMRDSNQSQWDASCPPKTQEMQPTCADLAEKIASQTSSLQKINMSKEALKPSVVNDDGSRTEGGVFHQGIEQLKMAAKDSGVSFNAFQTAAQELKHSYKNNKNLYWAGGAALGAGYLYKRHKDKKKAESRKKDAKRKEVKSAKKDLEKASACTQPGSEALPVCEAYFIQSCPGKYPTIEGGNGGGEKGAIKDKRDEILNAGCTNFVVKHCGKADAPTENTETPFCEDMLDKKYCQTSSNAKEPYCIMLANKNNPLCANGACDEPFTEEYMAENCPSVPDGKYCSDYLQQKADEELAAIQNQNGGTEGTASYSNNPGLPGSFTGGVSLNTPAVVQAASYTGYPDIAASFGPSLDSLVSSKVQHDCDNGVMVTCVNVRSPSSK